MKIKFKDIASRLTGISTPVFGISWKPASSEHTIARRVIAFLEDRRVLYVPSEVEIPRHCVSSIIEIRHFLTAELGKLSPDSTIAQSLSAMRSSFRKFLNAVQVDEGHIIQFGAEPGHYASWSFIGALGELRGVFGIHIAQLATSYGLDVEKDLASIIPEAEESD